MKRGRRFCRGMTSLGTGKQVRQPAARRRNDAPTEITCKSVYGESSTPVGTRARHPSQEMSNDEVPNV